MEDVVNTLTGWLPAWLEGYAQVLVYTAVLGAMAVGPLIAWLVFVKMFPAKGES
jgi:hypothetical protein